MRVATRPREIRRHAERNCLPDFTFGFAASLAMNFADIYNEGDGGKEFYTAVGLGGLIAPLAHNPAGRSHLVLLLNTWEIDMFQRLGKRPALAWAGGLTMGLLIGAGALLGGLAALSTRQSTIVFPELPLHATASHGESSITLATGDIDGSAEGLYVLDHVTGDLQCWVVSTRKPGVFSGLFKTNVLKDLGVEADKTPKFVMVTGSYNFTASRGTSRPASSLVYVGDTNTGNVVAYSLAWNSSLEASGGSQSGPLVPVVSGKGRNAAIRPGGAVNVVPQPR
jgi:hypothetical protein